MHNPTASFEQDAAIAAVSARLGLAPVDAPAPAIAVADPKRRHVLIVEPDGWTYLAPHSARLGDEADCLAAHHAARAFADHGTPPRPGRYWCDVAPDGNLEIGGRIA